LGNLAALAAYLGHVLPVLRRRLAADLAAAAALLVGQLVSRACVWSCMRSVFLAEQACADGLQLPK